VVNGVRRVLHLPYWSLAKYAKRKVKNAVELVSRFEEAVAHKAKQLGVNGVVCGHIHTAEIRQIGDITYYNDGDWMESSTSLVEHLDGTMEILHWTDVMQARPGLAQQAA
jgi:UDP-2,3-diacylglucosamine pyrophosphatase LpxH